jgi:hypothetical protein
MGQLCSLPTPAAAAASREWHFRVTLDGRAIGDHRFTLSEEGAMRRIVSEAQFRVRILFVDAYRYRHRAEEQWRGECLERLEAATDDDGKKSIVQGEQSGDSFELKRAAATTKLGECVQTFAYWNPKILEAQRLLNPQTGEYVPIQVLAIGAEPLAGHASANRYRLIGREGGKRLEIDVWYSDDRDWLALESLTPGGHRLRYARLP